MSTKVKSIIDEVIRVEGGYSNNKADRGGETMYGITAAVARANGYAGPMANMPRNVAERIYRKRYVEEPKFDQVLAISESVGIELIDTGVNMGPARAAEFLQRWLNGFNTGRYAELKVDGLIGPATRAALQSYLTSRGAEGEEVLVRGLNCSQGARYLGIAESNKSQRQFLYGWMRARVVL